MVWSTERLRAILVAAALAIAAGAGHGQIADMEPYQENAGLTSMAVECLAQAADGTLWIGTDNGLFVFDGFRIRRETLPKGAGAGITDLQTDRFNRLWIATDTGLYLRREDAGVTHWSAIVDPEGVGLGVWGKQRVAIDEHGAVFAMDRRSRIWTITVPPRLLDKVVASRMTMPAYEPYAGAYDADGGPLRAIGSALWFGCGHGLCRWLDGRLQAWGPEQGLAVDTWASLLGAHDGSVWARGDGHLARLAPDSDRFETVDAPVATLWPGTIAMAQDLDGQILTATADGIARWDGRSWRRWTPREGLPETAVRALLVDADGELWTGSAGRGVHRWIGYGRVEHWTSVSGLPSPVVWSFARDGAGLMRVATSHGVAGLDPRTGRLDAIEPLFAPTPAGSLTVDDAGAVWWVDAGRVLALEPGKRRARVAFRDPDVGVALQAAHSIVLSGTKNAERLVLSPKGPVRQPLPAHMPDPDSLAAVISDGQREWFLVDNKACRIDRGAWEPLQDERGNAVEVMGTAAFAGPAEFWAVDMHGVAVYQVTDGRARLKRRIDRIQLGTTDVEFLGADSARRVWIGTDRGVFVHADGRWTQLDRDSGLLWNDLDNGAVYFEQDGGVWIGSSKGATHVLPGRLAPAAPRLRVEDVRFGDGAGTRSVPSRVDWDDRRLRLTLQTAQIARGRSMRLEYRLNDGVAWEGFVGNVLQLESLEAGDYRLQVRAAANVSLLQPGVPLELAFSVAPPWWRSTPARVAYALGLAAAWFLSMQLLRVRASAMRARLEQAIAERTAELERSRELVRDLGVHNTRLLEEERKRVARELHDEMGQQLAALRMEISVLRRRASGNDASSTQAALGMLLVRVEDLVAGMRSVVAELRPPALDGGLAAALEWLVAAFERHADLPCIAEIDDCATLLSPDAAVMVFRIAQESLNNVRRHARAGHASLRLARAVRDCELAIADDGIGFDPSRRTSGYGILGMEERAIALGGTLEITSAAGAGCTVRLRLPLPQPGGAPAAH